MKYQTGVLGPPRDTTDCARMTEYPSKNGPKSSVSVYVNVVIHTDERIMTEWPV